VAPLAVLWAPATAQAANEEEALLEFNFEPVPDLQIAIWLEDTEGNYIKTVYVTQATGKLGIGNRPGLWNFLSSWRFPYGPRPNVLPVWAHRRGQTYPKLVFHDPKDAYQDSLGWHEGTSSDETYFCRPLTASEHEMMLDIMSCPSPNTFHSDKGKFDPDGDISYYPPRNDILEVDPSKDSDDVGSFADLNDLDAVTGATPAGNKSAMQIGRVGRDEAGDGPLVAFIEVSLEHDENSNWDFDRENDHYVDQRLASYGIEWLGQPSIVYSVEFDPGEEGWFGVTQYAGYGDLEGTSGELTPPDGTISTNGGSGADRLRQFSREGESMRFGLYSNGWGPASGDGDGDGDGGDGDGGDGDGDNGNGCTLGPMPPPEDLEVVSDSFDRVALEFTVPQSLDPDIEITKVNAYYQVGDNPITPENLTQSLTQEFSVCDDGCDMSLKPGDRASVEVDALFGDYTYQFAITYEDRCTVESLLSGQEVTTPRQDFAKIDTFCFVATAAWGGNWFNQVAALRGARDRFLSRFTLGRASIRFYYAYGPTVADLIAPNAYARATARVVLEPIAQVAELATRR